MRSVSPRVPVSEGRAGVPMGGAGIDRQWRAGRACLVAPRLPGHVPEDAGVAAGGVEIVVAGAVAIHARPHVLALKLERSVDPHRFGAEGADAVGVAERARVDEAVGEVGTR